MLALGTFVQPALDFFTSYFHMSLASYLPAVLSCTTFYVSIRNFRAARLRLFHFIFSYESCVLFTRRFELRFMLALGTFVQPALGFFTSYFPFSIYDDF